MKVALVYDRVNKWGGAERVLLALHEIWPAAPLYTAVYDPRRAPWASVFDVRASFLTNLPLARSYHELYPWLAPLAFETFNFDEFDLVISVTSAEAKGIITKPQTCHICYCLTPTRYLWSGYSEYLENPGLGKLGSVGRSVLTYLAPTLRRWDTIAAARPDYYLAISKHVAGRIKRYYDREAKAVIYPPVDIEKVKSQKAKGKSEDKQGHFLVVSRLVGYKRVDLIIDVFNTLGWPLVIVGNGLARETLEKQAKKNIQFIPYHLTDSELGRYYGNCRALVIAADEDFGIVAVEAQAWGKPVVAFGGSGVAETVVDGKTGLLFSQQTNISLAKALRRFETMNFDEALCKKKAQRFAKNIFQKEMKEIVEKLYQDYQSQ